jgi:hypothetical protein
MRLQREERDCDPSCHRDELSCPAFVRHAGSWSARRYHFSRHAGARGGHYIELIARPLPFAVAPTLALSQLSSMPTLRGGAWRVVRPGRAGGIIAALLVLAWAAPLRAQILASGSLRGEVVTAAGASVAGAQLTLTNERTGAVRGMRADGGGRFLIPLLLPGEYSLLAEEVGFQPVRQHGLPIHQGRESALRLVLVPQAPPITNVVEVARPVHPALPEIPLFGALLPRESIGTFGRRAEVTDLSREVSWVDGPRDERGGFVSAAGGLPGGNSRLFVDGLSEGLLRHPFVPMEPASAPAFGRAILQEAQVISAPFDAGWPGAAGAILTAASRSGTNDFTFEPSLSWSGGALAGTRRDNPADSSAMSLEAGTVLSGAVVHDIAHFLVALDYQTLEHPGAFPTEQDAASLAGAPVSARDAFTAIAADSFGTRVRDFTQPVVRSWRGGRAFARADWRLSTTHTLALRAGFARWNEQNPLLGADPISGLGTRLQARDLSAAFTASSSWRSVFNELHAGIREGRRVWTGLPLSATYLGTESIGIGAASALPGAFREQALELADVVQVFRRRHALNAGVGLIYSRWMEDYLYGAGGIFQFGDLDDFSAARGTYVRASGPSITKFSAPELGLFVQDRWEPTPGFSITGGLRFDRQWLSRGPAIDTALAQATGLRNDRRPLDGGNVGPRAGITWDVGNRHVWVVRAGAGRFFSRPDPALFAEALINDGQVMVRRAEGSLRTWPAEPDASVASVTRSRVTLFTPGYRNPRTTRMSLGVSHAAGRSVVIALDAGYHRTDFLLRRSDGNRLPVPVGQTQEGRPVFGALVQQGALISAVPGSNRHFAGFDLISELSSTGRSEAWEMTISAESMVGRGFRLAASYTLSHVRDDRPTGRTGDPADDLDPFPQGAPAGGSAAAWAQGRSDFDVPHRVVARAEYSLPRLLGLELAARYRFRSGRPFTPGFRPGVDVNGDGAGANDPAFLDPAIPGMAALIAANGCLGRQAGRFAARNSCREPGEHALDLHASIELPISSLEGRVVLTLDAFNVVSSVTGLRDRAAVQVDPFRSLVVDPAGNVILPLIANPGFGRLTSLRSEDRLLRVGLRMSP